MPFDTAIVGQSTAPREQQVDARWLMAYAASLNDYNPRYLDTQANHVVAHPVFPVCLEWPVILDTRSLSGDLLTAEESSRGVHAAHDLHLLQPIRAGDTLRTTATLIGAQAIRPGAAYTMQLDTTRVEDNQLVARTYQLGIYRQVGVQGEPSQTVAAPALPAWQDPAGEYAIDIPVAAGAAHTYTECAHIWNPIHTDRAVALAAGLPDIILHGTATMGLAVSRIVDKLQAVIQAG